MFKVKKKRFSLWPLDIRRHKFLLARFWSVFTDLVDDLKRLSPRLVCLTLPDMRS